MKIKRKREEKRRRNSTNKMASWKSYQRRTEELFRSHLTIFKTNIHLSPLLRTI